MVMKKGEKMSTEMKSMISRSKIGKPSWNKGKTMSDSMRLKMVGNKNGSGNKGRTYSPETITKMSYAKIGKISPRKGKKLSLESRNKISESKRNYFRINNPNYIPFSYDDRKKRRRERIKIYGGIHSNGEWEILKAQYNWTCPCCKKIEPSIKLTRDHIIPISRGGSDNIENIQPLCMPCNSRKGTSDIKY